jgi:hypothetical protein
MSREDWVYIPATDEKKIPDHPKVKTFLTSKGNYVSINDLPEKTLSKAIDFMESLIKLTGRHGATILEDDLSGCTGFGMDGFLFSWDTDPVQRIYVTDGHAVGTIVLRDNP